MKEFCFAEEKPEKRNIKVDKLNEFKRKIEKEKILSCLMLKNNSLVFQYYKNNKVADSLQTINSCTKSFISALIGILVDNGLIKSIHTPITEYFGDIINDLSDERLKKITIYHLLTMSPGFDWPEFGEWNCFSPMVYSNDIVKFVLERPFVAEPGQAMNYNSGCSHLLSAIIQKLTGMCAHDFAKEYLFKQLGICDTHWYDRNGISLGADGLRIKSYDMLKLGSLYLNNGNWNGKQIISSEWIKESTTPVYKTYNNIGSYACHWWASSVITDQAEVNFYFALGFGGQYIIIVPQYDLVTVITSRMYENSMKPLEIFKSCIAGIVGSDN